MKDYRTQWEKIAVRLQADLPDWKERIERFGQVAAIEARTKGRVFTDTEIFEGLIRAVLSNSIDWAKVEPVLPDLVAQCCNFRLAEYATLTDDDIEKQHKWFKEKNASSVVLRRGLRNVRRAAERLCYRAREFGDLDSYFRTVVSKRGDPCWAAVALGSQEEGDDKVPGFGIALAAEFLKNIGYDVSKPDRHINRAMGSFGWVQFNNWKSQQGWKAPVAIKSELISVMRKMEHFAAANALGVCYVDNAVWMLCAQSGAHLKNLELTKL